MPLKIITLDDLKLTDEEMKEALSKAYGTPITSDLLVFTISNKAINDAVAEKAMEILNRSIDPTTLVQYLLESRYGITDPDYLKKLSEGIKES